MESRASDTQADRTGQTYCYAHPKTPTGLRCSRCDRPICGRCAVPASVGQHCPECVDEARRKSRRARVRTGLAATAPAVLAILIVNSIVFLVQWAVPQFTLRFALIPPAVAEGEYWRLVTPMFLHAPDFLFHILINSYILYIYGPNVEDAFGTPRFLVLYLLAGFSGAVLSYGLSDRNIAGVGASGAIFGVAGALLVYLYNRRDSILIYSYMRNVVFFVGINLVFGFIIPRVDNYAHIGGLAAGALLGYAFDRRPTVPGRVVQVLAAVAVAGGGVALTLYRTATF